jgi:type IV pili sensor histidine kinase/response regulator
LFHRIALEAMLSARKACARRFHSGTPMNRIKHKISRRALLAISGLFAASLAIAGNAGTISAGISSDGTSEIQVGRYQSAIMRPDENQVDLLSVVITRDLPEHVNTVGQAVASLLAGSGYRLLSPKLAEAYRSHLFALPLPQVQRQLGPLSLRQALELLGGPAFRLVIEPTYRLVSFELIKTTSDTHACSCQ